MPALESKLRSQLDDVCQKARDVAEAAARSALQKRAVDAKEPFPHFTAKDTELRNRLRARGRQVGDVRNADKSQSIDGLTQELAYEFWHRMLFARFLAENGLLMHPDGVAVSLEECEELAPDSDPPVANGFVLAARYASKMLPQIFRTNDVLLEIDFAPEQRLALEKLLAGLPSQTFLADDSLGWVYQFWQTRRKAEVNAAGNKVGAAELPSVTQLFTEDYMVDFLLDNTLGAWHAGKFLATNPKLAETAQSEDELRQAASLNDCPWKYLRFIKGEGGNWIPAAGTFDGWPKRAQELKCLDPCMGSGHFVVAMFVRLVALRIAEEKLDEAAAVAAVIRENLFGLEIDPRCTQLAPFNLALAAWRRVGYCALPAMNLACSGLAPNATREEWLALVKEHSHLRFQMGALYELFEKAPTLGSLINPLADKAITFGNALQELQPILDKALSQEASDETVQEIAVTARGLAKAAEILVGQFTLIATNVPYLGRKKHDDVLKDYCERVHPNAKTDLATCFLERSLSFCAPCGSIALVTPQNWLSLGGYEELRKDLLRTSQWNFVARLGPKSFQTPMYDFNVLLIGLTNRAASDSQLFSGFDVGELKTPAEKDSAFQVQTISSLNQHSQLANPDARVSTGEIASGGSPLGKHVECYQGVVTGDLERFRIQFWEVKSHGDTWLPFRTTTSVSGKFDGLDAALRWEGGKGQLHEYAALTRDKLHDMHESGNRAWDKIGIAINRMAELRVSSYLGEIFDNNVAVAIPKKPSELPALLAFCLDPEFHDLVRSLDQTLKVTNRTLIKVPFDLGRWQKVAAEQYPHGLPKPFSSDPTQWLFNGHPAGVGQSLQVAVSRLLGYQWPRQNGFSFPDCPALAPDGLEKLADDDGIVCLPSVRGEPAAAERLLEVLGLAYGNSWSDSVLQKLLTDNGCAAGTSLDAWLRNQFFEQHCKLFHNRPFIWHIWDGRKDGFSVLVNCHKLTYKGLENLTYSYLGDWIKAQAAEAKAGKTGADLRLDAAQKLQEKLQLILDGEPDYDIFVRWKPLREQAIGWHPDLNDGVRTNIRPFVQADLLRKKPNTKWTNDRGKEPQREKEDYPWFWSGKTFVGDRVNDVHLTNEEKQAARDRTKKVK